MERGTPAIKLHPCRSSQCQINITASQRNSLRCLSWSPKKNLLSRQTAKPKPSCCVWWTVKKILPPFFEKSLTSFVVWCVCVTLTASWGGLINQRSRSKFISNFRTFFPCFRWASFLRPNRLSLHGAPQKSQFSFRMKCVIAMLVYCPSPPSFINAHPSSSIPK